ncbi:hypothetical protein [Georgenia deserti]|uniref:SPOR domain-containing protein n=1 Tax=Georgenia deserti TaxID=2093781 RepID=A0ABW4KZF0_9MICO
MSVKTWADGYGRWYATVPVGPDARERARAAIVNELKQRGEPYARVEIMVDPVTPTNPATHATYTEA